MNSIALARIVALLGSLAAVYLSTRQSLLWLLYPLAVLLFAVWQRRRDGDTLAKP